MKKAKLFPFATPFALILIIGLFAACANNNNTAGEQLEEVAEDIKNEFEEQKSLLTADINAAKKDIEGHIEKLKRDLETGSENAQTEINKQIEELEKMNADLDKKLELLGEEMKNNWKDLMAATRKTLENVDHRLEEMTSSGSAG